MAKTNDDVFDDVLNGCFGSVVLMFQIIGSFVVLIAGVFYLKKNQKNISFS